MLIARADTEKKQILVLGLSHENLKRLKEKQPIRLTAESHGNGIPEDLVIVIYAGEDERTMRREFQDAGMISDETEISIDPRLADG